MYAAGHGTSMPMVPVTVPLLKYAVVVAWWPSSGPGHEAEKPGAE